MVRVKRLSYNQYFSFFGIEMRKSEDDETAPPPLLQRYAMLQNPLWIVNNIIKEKSLSHKILCHSRNWTIYVPYTKEALFTFNDLFFLERLCVVNDIL